MKSTLLCSPLWPLAFTLATFTGPCVSTIECTFHVPTLHVNVFLSFLLYGQDESILSGLQVHSKGIDLACVSIVDFIQQVTINCECCQRSPPKTYIALEALTTHLCIAEELQKVSTIQPSDSEIKYFGKTNQ